MVNLFHICIKVRIALEGGSVSNKPLLLEDGEFRKRDDISIGTEVDHHFSLNLPKHIVRESMLFM